MGEKVKFGTRIGLIAATAGSAIGLGNIWRFPSEAQANGGGAFLIVYIACAFLLGIPVMLAEFSLGRAGGSDSVGNFKNLTPRNRWWVAGTIGLAASYLILSFYMVVAGWTFEYLWDSLTGNLFGGLDTAQSADAFFDSRMGQYIGSTWSPLIWTFVVIGVNLVLLMMGVQKGIEKMSNLLMPMLLVLLGVFCYAALSLPGAGEGVRFFLEPDFSAIDIDVVINALGQSFFSLSLGMGVLVTYSAYFPKNTRLGRTAMTVTALDFMVAFLMGLVIFPAVKSFGIDASGASLEGTTLVFVTMPQIFASMPGNPSIWATLFFLLLSVAALTSTISVAEVSVAFVRDRFHARRWVACLVVLCPLLLTSSLCSLSVGAVPALKIAGQSVFDFLDTYATNLLLPVSALLICIYVGWVLPRNFIKDQLNNFGMAPWRLSGVMAALIRYVCPLLILLVLIVKMLG